MLLIPVLCRQRWWIHGSVELSGQPEAGEHGRALTVEAPKAGRDAPLESGDHGMIMKGPGLVTSWAVRDTIS